jgi:hypothetical protein
MISEQNKSKNRIQKNNTFAIISCNNNAKKILGSRNELNFCK